MNAPPMPNVIAPLADSRVPELFARIERDETVDLSTIYQALIGPQYALRAYAARYLGSHGDSSSIGPLIAALSDESMHIGALYARPGMETTRYWANDSLVKLTKQDFGFVWNDPLDQRQAAIRRWQNWHAAGN